MDYYSITNELKEHIYTEYAKLKPLAEANGVYRPLDISFADEMPRGIGGTFCYADEDGYHYRYVERGTVQQHDITQSLFEISYWAIEPEVFHMACQYEKKHRMGKQDPRRIIFQKEMQFFELLDDNYKQRAESEIQEILERAPFQDELFK